MPIFEVGTTQAAVGRSYNRAIWCRSAPLFRLFSRAFSHSIWKFKRACLSRVLKSPKSLLCNAIHSTVPGWSFASEARRLRIAGKEKPVCSWCCHTAISPIVFSVCVCVSVIIVGRSTITSSNELLMCEQKLFKGRITWPEQAARRSDQLLPRSRSHTTTNRPLHPSQVLGREKLRMAAKS